jgi:hypothetical protein
MLARSRGRSRDSKPRWTAPPALEHLTTSAGDLTSCSSIMGIQAAIMQILQLLKLPCDTHDTFALGICRKIDSRARVVESRY